MSRGQSHRGGTPGEKVVTQRVFVALLPTAEVRARLSAIADAMHDTAPQARRIPTGNLHLTLAFIGSLAIERVAQVASHLARYEFTRFDWTLDRLGHFSEARVVWAGGPDDPALSALAAGVRRTLADLEVPYDEKPFAAHVTLLRNVRRWPRKPESIDPPIVWRCTSATLMRSEQRSDGVAYVPVTSP